MRRFRYPAEPLAPLPAEQDVPAADAEITPLAGGRWAAGYLLTENATAASYTPASNASYNYGGGAISVKRPAGTTGRYIVTFTGLSAALGGKNTVQVSAFGTDNTFCKAMGGSLAADKVEVRCYRTSNGSAVNTTFSLAVIGKSIERVFAFANQSTAAAQYTASNSGTWNPFGPTVVRRVSPGLSSVTFKKLAFPGDHAGNIQVHAVSSGKAHCKLSYVNPGADLVLTVRCYLPTGLPADAKFNVLLQTRNPSVAYAFAERADLAGEYDPSAYWSHNPSKGPILVWRRSQGVYEVFWNEADQYILDRGNVQVMDFGEDNYGHCKPFALGAFNVGVRCFAPNGTLADIPFMVLLGS